MNTTDQQSLGSESNGEPPGQTHLHPAIRQSVERRERLPCTETTLQQHTYTCGASLFERGTSFSPLQILLKPPSLPAEPTYVGGAAATQTGDGVDQVLLHLRAETNAGHQLLQQPAVLHLRAQFSQHLTEDGRSVSPQLGLFTSACVPVAYTVAPSLTTTGVLVMHLITRGAGRC